jgi:hypothetical protein
VLRFATLGSGYLGPGPDDTRRHGAGVWRVEGGEGQFAGARGLITSNFLSATTWRSPPTTSASTSWRERKKVRHLTLKIHDRNR